MKRKSILGALLISALILSACGTATPMPSEPGATTLPEGPAGEATLNISETPDFGSILVNGDGLSLYVFMQDTQGAGVSTCTGDCAVEWPPLVSLGSPVAGDSVDATMLSTITRDDGLLQVTYNGRPIYLFEEDAAPGDTNGQGLEEFGGLWFLVSPAGESIQQSIGARFNPMH